MSGSDAPPSLLRLFKLKKRYRNVLDTMFELLPRMARYCPASGPQRQASYGLCPPRGGQPVVEGGRSPRKDWNQGSVGSSRWLTSDRTGLPGPIPLC